jgi:glycosyltransferase involved in cell wall biosynthesis
VTVDASGRRPAVEEREGVLVWRFRSDSPRGAAKRLGRWLRQNARRYRLVHAHSYHTPLAVQAALVAKQAGVPLVLSPYYLEPNQSLLRRALHSPYQLVGRWLVRRAAQLIYFSQTERALLERRFGVARAHVVAPCGVEVERIHSGIPAAALAARKTILTVGRPENDAQTERLVAALRYMPEEYELVVIGDEPLRQRLEALALQTGQHERLKLLGPVSQQGLCAWYHCADAFVSLARHESFGLTLLEAATAGAPLVMSDIAAHHEAAGYLPEGRAVFVDDSFGAADVAHAVEEAVRCGRASETSSWRLPTWDAMCDAIASRYAGLIGRRPDLYAAPSTR